MRPVNLIPPEERRGDQAPLRTGPLSYILIGGLVLVLAGVVALVLTGNQISESKSELTTLKREDAAAKAKAARLAPYAQFQSMSEARVQTVQSLADSRFDWERVLRELALILPSDVHLTELSASSGGEAGAEGGGSEAASLGGLSGPSMTMSGCASGQDGVAAFVTALKDIDGVTRVGLQSSSVSGEGGETGGSEAGCSVAPGTATFALVVAFDAAPVASAEGAIEAAPEAAPEAAQAASSETSESSSESSGESSEGE
jgi:Tfp pilus assembly protein PilN